MSAESVPRLNSYNYYPLSASKILIKVPLSDPEARSVPSVLSANADKDD